MQRDETNRRTLQYLFCLVIPLLVVGIVSIENDDLQEPRNDEEWEEPNHYQRQQLIDSQGDDHCPKDADNGFSQVGKVYPSGLKGGREGRGEGGCYIILP